MRNDKPREFVETTRLYGSGRVVHLVLDAENLLCAQATFDAADSEGDESMRWHPTKKRMVTCPQCVEIIRLCANVRTSEADHAE